MKIIKKRTLKIASNASNGASGGAFQWNRVLLLGAILLSFLFVGNLRAQEAPEIASQKGWFVGVNPLIFGANKIETRTTTSSTGGGELVVSDLTADAPSNREIIRFNSESAAKAICADDTTIDFLDRFSNLISFSRANVFSRLEIFYLAEDRSDATDLTITAGGAQFDAANFILDGVEISFTEDPTLLYRNSVNSPIADGECKKAFDGLLLEDQSSTAGSSETSTGKALAGNGLQVGYRDGDYRYSLSNYSWAAGSDKLDSQVLLIEYFIAKGFSAGIGVANVKLDSSAGLYSQRANVYSLSYHYPIWKNLFVEASYMLISADISVQKEELKVLKAVTQTDTREIGFFISVAGDVADLRSLYYDGAETFDGRVTVKRTQTQTAGTRTITKSVEIKNPAAFRINFIWRFR